MSLVCPQCNAAIAHTHQTKVTCPRCGYTFNVALLQHPRPKTSHQSLWRSLVFPQPVVTYRRSGNTLLMTRTRASQFVVSSLMIIGGVTALIAMAMFRQLNVDVVWWLFMAIPGAIAALSLLQLVLVLTSSSVMRVTPKLITVQHNFQPARDLTLPVPLIVNVEVEENNRYTFDVVARLRSGKYALILAHLPLPQANLVQTQLLDYLSLDDEEEDVGTLLAASSSPTIIEKHL
jgi:DNA-directed RNA polymerase subunit RPC12/RpoP